MDYTDKLDILYARRSSEDGKDGESIENQIALLKQYAADKGYYNIKIVTDDGYTGTNFNRPGFQEAGPVKIRACISVICDNLNVIVPYIQSFHKFMLRIL